VSYDDDPYDDYEGQQEPDCFNCNDNGYTWEGTRCRWCRPSPRQIRREPLQLLWGIRHQAALERRREKAIAKGKRVPAWDERPF
jgi:hypothetical protein